MERIAMIEFHGVDIVHPYSMWFISPGAMPCKVSLDPVPLMKVATSSPSESKATCRQDVRSERSRAKGDPQSTHLREALRVTKLAIQGTCLCQAVQLSVARMPRQVTQCNCSLCRRYGTLWAYYKRSAVSITAPRGALDNYKVRTGGLKF